MRRKELLEVCERHVHEDLTRSSEIWHVWANCLVKALAIFAPLPSLKFDPLVLFILPFCKAVQALQTTYGVQEELTPHRIDYERWEMMEEKYPSLADEMGRKSMLIGLNMFSTTSENGHAPKWHKHAAAWADDLHLKVVLKLWNRKRNGSAQAAVECYFFSRSFWTKCSSCWR